MKNKLTYGAVSLATGTAVLRASQCQNGFDESGLPVDSVWRVVIPAIIIVTAALLVFATRGLNAKRGTCGDITDNFAFSGNTLAVACAVAGSFLVMAGGAASLMGRGSLGVGLLSVFAVAAALCVLYVVFSLYRENAFHGVALLVPVCCLVVYLIFLYRADASEPVLAKIYIELLAAAALTYASLERAAFAFANGSPRLYLPVNAMAFVLAVCAAAEMRSMAATLLFAGCALIELGFLRAANFEKN